MENGKCVEIAYKKLEPSSKSCMRISAIILFSVFLIPATFIALFWLDIGSIGKVVLVAHWILAVLYVAFAPNVRYERYRYCIDDEAIRVRSGFLWISEDMVPIERLHKLQTSQGPIARFFKLSTISVTTAGGVVAIKFLSENQSEEIAEMLKKKINDIAIREREN